jgi:hypothetical protein
VCCQREQYVTVHPAWQLNEALWRHIDRKY